MDTEKTKNKEMKRESQEAAEQDGLMTNDDGVAAYESAMTAMMEKMLSKMMDRIVDEVKSTSDAPEEPTEAYEPPDPAAVFEELQQQSKHLPRGIIHPDLVKVRIMLALEWIAGVLEETLALAKAKNTKDEE